MSATATVPVTWKSVHLNGEEIPVLVRPGFGSLLLAAKGTTTFAYHSTATDDISGAFANAAGSL